MMRMKLVAVTAAAVTLLAATGASHADKLEDAVKARQSYYQVVKFNAGPLFAMMKGSMDYDAETAQTHANNLKTLTALKNGAMWPKGSSKSDLPGKTRALAAIWEAGSTVGEKGAAYRKAVAELAEAAGQSKDAMAPKVRALGASCSACHKEYRAKEF
jgi:cytochrome c556